MKTVLAVPALLSAVIGFSSFAPQNNASIVGTWKLVNRINHVAQRGGGPVTKIDTVVLPGFVRTFTADGQYNYKSRNDMGKGVYKVEGSTLSETDPRANMTRKYKILTLTDHKLVVEYDTPPSPRNVNPKAIFNYTR